jgi:predicted ester cyclase
MSEQNKAVVQQFEHEFKNKQNIDIVDRLFAQTFVHHIPFPGLPAGREGLKATGRSIFAAFAHEHLHADVELCLDAGDRVITRTRVRARHTGAFNGIPATNRDVGWTEITIYRLEGGKITEMIAEGNFLGLMAQLGPPS